MSDVNNNQSAERVRTPTKTSGGGVFSWFTGHKAPAPETVETTTSTIATSNVQSSYGGSPSGSGNRSPARTVSPVGSGSRPRSPVSGFRSPPRSPVSGSQSPPRSPARRFVIPTVAMGMGGAGRGPAVMMDIGQRTVYAQSDDDDTSLVADDASEPTIVSTMDEIQLPPGVKITTKTVEADLTENQLPEGTHMVRTVSTSEDNQVEPTSGPTKLQYFGTFSAGKPSTVRYVTKSEDGDNQETVNGNGNVRYTTTTVTTSEGDNNQVDGDGQYLTTSSVDGACALPPLISPASQSGNVHVRYIAKSVASPARVTSKTSPGGVRYMSKTMAVEGGHSHSHGLPSPAAPSPVATGSTTNVRFFGPPTTQPNVHYVTRVVNGQSVQVPVPAGVPSHDHRVHYVTSTGSAASVTSASPVPSPSEHQHVRYIVKSATPPPASPAQQVRVVTRTVTESEGSESGSQHVPLSAVVASTVASRTGDYGGLSPAHHVPASLLRLDSTMEGLPSRQFRGIALTDTDSSDGEDHDVKMVFDIMLQKFVPVNKKRRSSKGAAAAAAAAGTGGASAEAAEEKNTTNAAGGAESVVMAAGAGAVAVAIKAETELEEKAAAPSTTDTADVEAEKESKIEEKAIVVGDADIAQEEEGESKGNGLAIGAAIGLTAIAAAVTVAASNEKPQLDTIGTPKAAVARGDSPSGLKKRTPSQVKHEPSPRKFFAAPAANKAPVVPDHEVTLDMDAPGTQYAELRSPSSNEIPGNSRLGHVGMSLKVRVCRWLLITLLSLAIIVFLMILFYKGVTLRKFDSSKYSYAKQNDMLDNYNGYVGLVASLFSKPIELLIAIVVPILFFSFVAKALLGEKLSPRLLTFMFSLSSILGFLISNGFHGINVQMRAKGVAPVIGLGDLSLQASAALALGALVAANASSNASMVILDGGAGNAITNTVLRTVVAAPIEDATDDDSGAAGTAGGAVPTKRQLQALADGGADASSSSLLCSNTIDYRNLLGTSDLGSLATMSTKTVATFGFPMRSWQDQMLPGALPETTVTITLDGKTPSVGSLSTLPMRVRTAANLFLQSVHISRDVFRWFDDNSIPLDVAKAVNTKFSSKTETTYAPLASVMDLTVEGNIAEETLAAPAFVKQVRTLYNQSLAGAANISRSESTLEFSSVTLPNGYAYDSVTMEIPLVKSFLSRRLTRVGSAFAEGTAPTNETDVFYDLDIANDCGPYAGNCEVRRTEYDADGRVYEPPTTIRAFALCNNSLGNDDLEVFFAGEPGKKTVSYTCNGKSDDGMLVVSVSSRIVGEAMIEGPSNLVPRLVTGMATLKNPRKVYSLTVGKLSWPKTNLALKFHAACAVGVGKCTGLDYALSAALENATETLLSAASGSLRGVLTSALNQEQNKDQEYLIVGSNFLPLKIVPTFAYNNTEAAVKNASTSNTTTTKSVSGYPLVTITKPLEADSLFQNDGDVVVGANFKNVTWPTTKPRTGASCSATVEARLDSVLNNHYYIDRGVQPAYTAGMYFLFQNAVTRTQIALGGGFASAGSLSTLRFAQTVEFMELRATIPLLNFVLTLVGCGIIFVISLLVAMRSARKQYSASEGHDTYAYAPPESFARVKLDRALFPWIVLKRRVVDFTAAPMSTTTATTGAPSSKGPNSQNGGGIVGGGDEGERIDAFTVGAVRLEHDQRDVTVDVPYGMDKGAC